MLGHGRPLVELSLFALLYVELCGWWDADWLHLAGFITHRLSTISSNQAFPLPLPAALRDLMANGCRVNQSAVCCFSFSFGKWVEFYDPRWEHIGWSGKSYWGFLILGDPTLFIANTHWYLCRIEPEERLRLKSESGSQRKTLGIVTKRGRTQ